MCIRDRYYSVPNAHNAFILSWMGNAIGFVGLCIVLGALLALVIKTLSLIHIWQNPVCIWERKVVLSWKACDNILNEQIRSICCCASSAPPPWCC